MSVAQILTYQTVDADLKTFVDNQYHSFWNTTDGNIKAESIAPLLTPATVIASNLISGPTLACQTIDTLAAEGTISIVAPVTTNQSFSATGSAIISSEELLQAPTVKIETIQCTAAKPINVINDLDLGANSLNGVNITGINLIATNNLVLDNGDFSLIVNLPNNTMIVNSMSASGFDAIGCNTVQCGNIFNPTEGLSVYISSNLSMLNKNIDSINGITANSALVQQITAVADLVVTGTITDLANNKGTLGQVLVSGGPESYVRWDSLPQVSNWSTYSAISSVDLDGFKIIGANSVACNNLIPTYRQSNTYYVSPNGDDALNNGTFESPYATITKCLQVTEALTAVDDITRTINLSVGTYTEDLTLNYKVSIFGQGKSLLSSSPSDTTVIVGSLTINLATSTSTLFQNVVTLDGLSLSGYVTCTSSADSCLTINNCYIYSQNNVSGRAINYSPVSNNTRFRMTNSQVTSGGNTGLDPLIEVSNGGQCGFNNNQFTSKGVQNVLKLSGTATVSSMSNCIFESDSTSATVPSIIYITTVNSSVVTLSNNAFVYGSNTSKASNSYASGVCCEALVGNPTVLISYCSFILQGTTSANFAIQDKKALTATQMVCLFFSNNSTLGNAFAINAVTNTNKFTLVPVV